MKVKKGDYVYWNLWYQGYVLEAFPKGILFIRGMMGNYREQGDFNLDIKEFPVKVLKIGSEFRLLNPAEEILHGDEAFTGEMWVNIPYRYSADRFGFAIRRKI